MTEDRIPLFLPPKAPPPPKQHLASTQDLLARFQLLPAYNKYVRPSVQPLFPHQNHQPSSPSSPFPPTPDKGKARELPLLDVGPHSPNTHALSQQQAQDVDMGDGDDGDEPGGKGEKKKKNSYKHLIKGIPGKHSLKKDDYLTYTMLAPPKQRVRIVPFDTRTQEDAFSVSLEGLKGWNINTLVLESAQAREDRRKRKELKKLAKAGGGPVPPPSSAMSPGTPSASTSLVQQPQPIAATPVPMPGSAIKRSFTPQQQQGGGAGAGTPRGPPGGSRPASTAPLPPNVGPSASSSSGVATSATASTSTSTTAGPPPPVHTRPTSTVPRPGSAVPRPGSGVKPVGGGVVAPSPRPVQAQQHQQQQQRVGTPMQVDSMGGGMVRGKKRDREDGVVGGGGGGGHLNGNGNGHVPKPVGGGQGQGQPLVNGGLVVNAKAGSAGVRPRPIKKQRMDGQGHARDINVPPVQQPTPQGG